MIKYLPANAGSQIFASHPRSDMLSPWAGLGVLSLYVVVIITVAGMLITRRHV